MTQSTAGEIAAGLSTAEQATYNRAFELAVLELIKRGLVRCPTYLSLGAEHVPPAVLEGLGGERWPLFAQHRCHSWCLTWGMSPGAILDQLIGGVQGSASLADRQANVFGHDGFLGSNAPIAVGYAQATKRPVVCVLGDGACEEDHVLGALGHAASVKAPVLFVVEDNGLSVATEKQQRRTWSVGKLARPLGIFADRVNSCEDIILAVDDFKSYLPVLIEVSVTRLCAHNSTRDQSCGLTRCGQTRETVEAMVDTILQRWGGRQADQVRSRLRSGHPSADPRRAAQAGIHHHLRWRQTGHQLGATVMLLRWALHHFGLHWWREWDSTYHAVTYRRCRVCGLLETVEKRWLF